MFSIYDWDSIYEYFYEQAMNDIKDEDYAHAYGKSQADLYYTSESRNRRWKNDKATEKKAIKKQYWANYYIYNVFVYGYDDWY